MWPGAWWMRLTVINTVSWMAHWGAVSGAPTFWLHILPEKLDKINPIHRKGHFVKFKTQLNKLKGITDLNVRAKTTKPLGVNPSDFG